MEPNEDDPFAKFAQSGNEGDAQNDASGQEDPFDRLSKHFEEETPVSDPLASPEQTAIPTPTPQPKAEGNNPLKNKPTPTPQPKTPTPKAKPQPTPTAQPEQPVTSAFSQEDRDRTVEYAAKLIEASQYDYKAKNDNLRKILEDEDKSDIMLLAEQLFAEENRKKTIDTETKDEIYNKLIHLTAKINEDIRFYERKSGSTRSWSLIFRLLSTALAAVVTVLLGINVTGWLDDKSLFFGLGVPWMLNTLALTISAFLTVLSDLKAFTDSDSLSIKFTDTMYKLKQIRDNIEYLQLGGEYVTLRDVNSVKLQYDRIIEQTNRYIVESALDSESSGNRINLKGK